MERWTRNWTMDCIAYNDTRNKIPAHRQGSYPPKLQLYPLQMANGERLEKNNAVYIFDEVGCGKTISAGIMAMDYLENNPDRRILVITTNTLRRSGQFENDWIDKFPPQMLEHFNKGRIKIINNLENSELDRGTREDGDYGLVIIDEAHMFLNDKTERFRTLCRNARAQKVVFLTATPFKNDSYGDINDLRAYIKIAMKLTEPEFDAVDPDDLPPDRVKERVETLFQYMSTPEKDPDKLICCTFDPQRPVTRYFKETVQKLTDKDSDRNPYRRRPDLRCYDGGPLNKNWALLDYLKERMAEPVAPGDPPHRFVIFTCRKQECYYDGAEHLYKFLIASGRFAPFDKNADQQGPTVALVVGGQGDIRDYSDCGAGSANGHLPTVLILTYQIAEQGVNLPDFDHVIHYHIPAAPSSLEQRLGRIDRMRTDDGKPRREITACYLLAGRETLDENGQPTDDSVFYTDRDSGTRNFFCAVGTYLHTVLTYLPSKNVLLTDGILKRYKKVITDGRDHFRVWTQALKDLKADPSALSRVREILTGAPLREEDSAYPLPAADSEGPLPEEDSKDPVARLTDLLVPGQEVPADDGALIALLEKELEKKRRALPRAKGNSDPLGGIEKFSDQVFCLCGRPGEDGKPQTVQSADVLSFPTDDCARYISLSADYCRYRDFTLQQQTLRFAVGYWAAITAGWKVIAREGFRDRLPAASAEKAGEKLMTRSAFHDLIRTQLTDEVITSLVEKNHYLAKNPDAVRDLAAYFRARPEVIPSPQTISSTFWRQFPDKPIPQALSLDQTMSVFLNYWP